MVQANEAWNVRAKRSAQTAHREAHGKQIAGDSGIQAACSGTDVRAPELSTELERATWELVSLMAPDEVDAEEVPGLLFGGLMRIFWMGYAYGEAATE